MPAGFTGKAGIKREADSFSRLWPSASVIAITQLLPLLSENVNQVNDQESIVTKDGRSIPSTPKLIRSSVGGDVRMDLHYEGLEQVLAFSLGQVANRIGGILMPEDVNADQTTFRHVFEIDAALKQEGWKANDGFIAGDPPVGDGLIAGLQKLRRFTYAVFKGSTAWDVLSCMVNSISFEMNGNSVTANINITGYSQDFDSAVNAGISALSNCPDSKIVFNQGTLFFLELPSIVAFTPGLDEVGDIVSFNVQINNGLQFFNTRDTGVNIDEPQKTGVTGVTGSFALPRFSNLDMITRNRDSVQGKMLFQFEGEGIPGSIDNYVFNFWFPNVTLTGGEISIQDSGQIQQNFAFIASNDEDDLDPVGFPETSRKNALTIELYNAEPLHPLLD